MPQISPILYLVIFAGVALLLLGATLGFLNSNKDYIAQGTSNIYGVVPGGESGAIETGYKALHVKLDVGDPANPKIYEFHPTNEGALGNKHYSDKSMDDRGGISQYFDIKNWKDNKCALFTTLVDNTPSPIIWKTTDPLDKNYIYYIDSGTIISSDITKNPDLKSAIDGRYERGCETIQCGDFNTGDYTVCATACTIWPWWECKDAYFFECKEDASNKVLNQPFGGGTDLCQKDTAGCPSNGCCSLLSPAPDTYTPAGGIMCGYRENDFASAKWWICARENVGTLVYTGLNPDKAQYKCAAKTSAGGTVYDWVAAADQGISLENIQIKYDSTLLKLGDDYTSLSFFIANQNTAPISDVSVKATVDDSGAACSKFDCSELSTDKSKDSAWAEVGAGKLFSSQGLDCGTNIATSQLYKEFCYKAKKFSVELKYAYSGKSLTNNFEVTCSPPSADTSGEWQKNVCTATAVSSAQTPATGSASSTGASCSGGTYTCRSQSTCTSSNIGGTVENTKTCSFAGTVCCTK